LDDAFNLFHGYVSFDASGEEVWGGGFPEDPPPAVTGRHRHTCAPKKHFPEKSRALAYRYRTGRTKNYFCVISICYRCEQTKMAYFLSKLGEGNSG
ncbi:MAG: hypothetical protein AB7E65_08705, partial [Syntrophotalea sp.]|uniref:hypothetical protein n=1 Tax=Syntrophotalea sp. TaxID=2812029 RepID=UPI003D0C3249